ncbi:MAG: 1,4-dihydroxy-2-naphthoate octaprenyltransferase [Prevotella sp.]|nr:1,4-dihydroxy-2-naphthoate octaprenyltransferase [Prevotella sp.]
MEKEIRQNSLKAWILAARPKTLTGAAVPVMMGTALAWKQLAVVGESLDAVPAVLCLLFAFIMQIDANFVNDYFDFKKGVDDEHRLGPRRSCAQGWVSQNAMRWAIAATTLAACVVGLPLIFYGGMEMIWVGAACVAFCFLYTTVLSHIGLGDLLVLMFFGIVPVCITFYVQTHTVTKEVFLSSLACGMVIDTLLMVNNYRDRDNDLRKKKRTLVVLIGPRASELLYFALGLLAFHLGLAFFVKGEWLTFFLPALYLALHAHTYRKMKKIKHGKALNLILSENARNMFIYGLLFSIGVVLDRLLGFS